MRTPVGVLQIRAVTEIEPDEIDDTAARRAGFDDRSSLLEQLSLRGQGDLYRIELGDLEPDPRAALRETTDLTDDEVNEVDSRLEAIDQRSKDGPWTEAYIRLIADNPGVGAQDLADLFEMEKSKFKNRVRRLKELGLTISLSPGYELSARGREVLESWGRR